MFSPRRMWAVTMKETQELVRNWMSCLLTIIAPIILYFLFAYGFPLEVKNIPIGVLDEDRTKTSRELIDTFSASKVFKIKQYIDRFEDIDTIIRQGKIRLVLVIPEKFEERIRQGMPQSVQVIIDAIYTSRAQMSGGYADTTVAAFSEKVFNDYFRKRFGPGQGAGSGMPVELFVSPWFNPTFRSEDFIIPGVIAIVLVFLPPTIMAISITKEKETGMILNMYCSPVTKTEFILGKAVPYTVLTYANCLLFIFLSVFLFGVPFRGNIPLMLGVSLLYVIVVIGIGVFVAVLVPTQIAGILITSIVNLVPTFMYSGFMLPIICMDQAGKETAYMLPPTYYIDFTRKLMLKGVGLEYLWEDIVVLSAMAVGLFVISIILFRKRLG
ncbi:MAG: ABC transporter permease [Candidatus Eremiobacteraeota bacterium]|nr:ABC transporter permease [Candidatus Eremiobacteraeota bacterium]